MKDFDIAIPENLHGGYFNILENYVFHLQENKNDHNKTIAELADMFDVKRNTMSSFIWEYKDDFIKENYPELLHWNFDEEIN